MGLSILFLESFYGGSHRRFADDFAAASSHRVNIYSMPPRFWKWRTRGAAPYFASAVSEPQEYDLIIATDLLNLAELKGLWPCAPPPTLLYFHENQLLYPLSPGEERDFHYGLTDTLSALAADRIAFNSRTHQAAFFEELPRFLSRFPDYRLTGCAEELRQKSRVLYPGISAGLESYAAPWQQAGGGAAAQQRGPLIIWNHRWEHDKNPESFFRPLFRLAEEGLPFRLALLGEQYSKAPPVFSEARQRLGDRIIRFGYAEEREEYLRLLGRGDLVVSTARQENFGLAVIEAIRCGCRPLLPRRLSYPELIPERFHPAVLYDDEEELYRRLRDILRSPDGIALPALAGEMRRFEWPNLVGEYDALCSELAAEGRRERGAGPGAPDYRRGAPGYNRGAPGDSRGDSRIGYRGGSQ
jgi:glycosyltransferase involved in cell wall biosynthesis